MTFLDLELFNSIRKNIPICCIDLLFVDFDNRILLMRRCNHPAKDSLWFPGGRLLKDEKIDQAIRRKSIEETSIYPISFSFVDIQETIFSQTSTCSYSIHTINLCFLISWSKNPQDALINDSQHSDLVWLPISDAISRNDIHSGVSNPLRKLNYVV